MELRLLIIVALIVGVFGEAQACAIGEQQE